MRNYIATGLLLTTTLFAQAAFAETECTTEPKDKWMTELDMQKKIVGDMGHIIYKFKVTDGNCYEIYGMGPKEGSTTGEMEKVEIYFSPIDGSIAKKKIES